MAKQETFKVCGSMYHGDHWVIRFSNRVPSVFESVKEYEGNTKIVLSSIDEEKKEKPKTKVEWAKELIGAAEHTGEGRTKVAPLFQAIIDGTATRGGGRKAKDAKSNAKSAPKVPAKTPEQKAKEAEVTAARLADIRAKAAARKQAAKQDAPKAGETVSSAVESPAPEQVPAKQEEPSHS